MLLREVVRICRSVWGARVQMEPEDYAPYSDYRPDMAAPHASESGSTYLGELKLIDPLSSNPADIMRRGAKVAFGNTEPSVKEKVYVALCLNIRRFHLLSARGENSAISLGTPRNRLKPLENSAYLVRRRRDFFAVST